MHVQGEHPIEDWSINERVARRRLLTYARAPFTLVPLAVAALFPAAAAFCVTATQLPKPPAVVKLTRHVRPLLPPVHLVPVGSFAVTRTEPVVVGDC